MDPPPYVRRTLKVRSLFAVSLLLLLPAVAAADIGVTELEPRVARPGETIRITVRGYLGYEPWKPMPVVLVPASRAPQPYRCRRKSVIGICTPSVYPRQLVKPPYRPLGSVRRWKPFDSTMVNAVGVLAAQVPATAPGRYLLGLFCASCTPGPKGSVIIDYRLGLTVHR